MKRSILLLAGFALALPMSAAPKVAVKCASNEERVWVYDDLVRLNVAARLKCGDSVEVLGAEKAYVRVRTADGTEGYVAQTSIPLAEAVTLVSAASSAPAAAPVPDAVSLPSSPTPLAPVTSVPQTVAVAPAVAKPMAAKPSAMKPADFANDEDSLAGAPNGADLDGDDDTPDTDSASSGSAVACSVYFSAYGATPAQLQWLAVNRVEQFPAVCPAPEPSAVDYVVIFTHDNNRFSASMPEPIHTDQNGFSDWAPVTAIDDTLIPPTSLDKAQREYAWVFRVERGSFDPVKFSSQQEPQFTKTEHSSTKAAEDAFRFMAQSDVGQGQ